MRDETVDDWVSASEGPPTARQRLAHVLVASARRVGWARKGVVGGNRTTVLM